MENEDMKNGVPYLLQLIMHYLELEKKIQYYGTDIPIHHSEIHMISAIAKRPEINVKGLAEYFKITSASVSEMLSKLQRKGLIEKTIDKNNRVNLRITLTDKGMIAHKEHMQYHQKLNQMIAEELSGVSDDQIDAIRNFLKNMCNRLDHFEIRT